jgi:hypothetical protein
MYFLCPMSIVNKHLRENLTIEKVQNEMKKVMSQEVIQN